jgi:hypothetical protein
VQTRRRAQLTGPNRSTDLPRPSGKSSPESREQKPRDQQNNLIRASAIRPPTSACHPCQCQSAPRRPRFSLKESGPAAPDVSLAWWSWRGCPTRSHSELGRETPQRPWYCALRHGRVGRRQANQTSGTTGQRAESRPAHHHPTPHPEPPDDRRSHGAVSRGPRTIARSAGVGLAGWSSPVARQAHNLKVAGSNPAPATKSGRSCRCLEQRGPVP